MKTMAHGYMLLENYQIKKAIDVFKSLGQERFETPWILSLVGKAYYQINEYHEVIGHIVF